MIHDAKPPCPLCESPARGYLFTRHGARVTRCTHCGLTRLDERGSAAAGDAPTLPSSTEKRAAEGYLAAYRERGGARSRMLAVVDAGHPFIDAARADGFAIAARQSMHEIERSGMRAGPYDGAVVLFQLEKATNPIAALTDLHHALVPGAVLLVVAPSLDSWPARLLRGQWMNWQPGHRTYFDTQTIQSALLRSGFAELEWSLSQRRYSIEHVQGRAAGSMPTALTRTIRHAARVVPPPFRRQAHLPLPSSAIVVTGRHVALPPRPLLSIVMPVFNERATFEATLQAVLDKPLPGVDKEIVIVESRSTDGTRELVERYAAHPDVTVILEDRPRGKGAAVRAGLQRARGTLILIQDADSEYDVNDYDALLEPLLTWQRAFVLGSRHAGNWKVRRFAEQRATTAFFNAGHVIFATALNVLYGQKIQDPFTMYKVFRRDCLHGLRFECNRFDFDFELVIKLVRKGYVPLEVPVNYESRSFDEGKKVSVVRDPLTWIRALVKFRFASIYSERHGRRESPAPRA
jgi:glycosyltransferase involved in cell wall biosynthesis